MTTTTQGVSFDALLGALLMHQHQVVVVVADTEAALLAQTPAAGTFGYASDTRFLYYYDGAAWKSSALEMGTVSTGVDMGAFRYRDDQGYGQDDLSDKTLHTIRLGGYNTAIYPAVEGAVRFDFTNKYIEVYQNAAWRIVQAMSIAEADDRVKWSDYDVYTTDGYGNPLIDDNGQLSMGALAVECIQDGGTLS